jgi:hypothetical protein
MKQLAYFLYFIAAPYTGHNVTVIFAQRLSSIISVITVT